MMNKSLLAHSAKSSRNSIYGFRRGDEDGEKRSSIGAKKEPPKRSAALKVDNREASNRVDRSHSVSKQGRPQS